MKNLSTALSDAFHDRTVSIATLLWIKRPDGFTHALTNNTRDITVDGITYKAGTQFIVGDISQEVDSVPNTTITLSTGGEFDKEAFRAGRYAQSEVKISQVEFTASNLGAVTIHAGFIGTSVVDQAEHVSIDVYGLTKALDLTVGRVYQPLCDATYGDHRCGFALEMDRAYSVRNSYTVGSWVYRLDENRMTAVTLANPSFEADGAVTHLEDITGWTRDNASNSMRVANTAQRPSGSGSPADGSYVLRGGGGENSQSGALTQVLTQRIHLVNDVGLLDTAIDAGEIVLAFQVACYTADQNHGGAIRMRYLDNTGRTVAQYETPMRDVTLDVWHDLSLVRPVFAGVREVVLELVTFRETGLITYVAFDDVRLFQWNSSVDDPTYGLVYKVTRTLNSGDTSSTSTTVIGNIPNGDFEADGVVAAGEAITAWENIPTFDDACVIYENTRNSFMANVAKRGSPAGTSTTGLATEFLLADVFDGFEEVDASLSFQLSFDAVVYATTGSLMVPSRFTYTVPEPPVHHPLLEINLIWLDGTDTEISTTNIAQETYFGNEPYFATQWSSFWKELVKGWKVNARYYRKSIVDTIPANAVKLRIEFYGEATTSAYPHNGYVITSGGVQTNTNSVAAGGQILIDNVSASLIDPYRPQTGDPEFAQGDASTVFPTSVDDIVIDGDLVWRAHSQQSGVESVSQVVDTRTFRAPIYTVESAGFGMRILWLSGANAGQTNVVRSYNPDNGEARLYFAPINPIAVGDRFQYQFACGRRFLEDCVIVSNNAVNFRGFPHLPGKLDVLNIDPDAEPPTLPPRVGVFLVEAAGTLASPVSLGSSFTWTINTHPDYDAYDLLVTSGRITSTTPFLTRWGGYTGLLTSAPYTLTVDATALTPGVFTARARLRYRHAATGAWKSFVKTYVFDKT